MKAHLSQGWKVDTAGSFWQGPQISPIQFSIGYVGYLTMGGFCVLRGSITIVSIPRALVPMCKYFIKPVPASHLLASSPLAKPSHMDKLSQYKRESYKDLNTGKCSLGGPPKWAAKRIRWPGTGVRRKSYFSLYNLSYNTYDTKF